MMARHHAVEKNKPDPSDGDDGWDDVAAHNGGGRYAG
jgi:hypothetical protein